MTLRPLILLTWLIFSALPARAEDLLVFAAASLKEPLDAIAAMHGGLTVSYGGSGTLARQILAGAPADVVILAHVDWMATLEQADRLVAPSVDLLSNQLVVIAPAGADNIALEPDAVDSALGDGRIAMGLTQSVPAGIYGKAGLTNLGLWDNFADRLAEVDSVRAVLALVARGEVPLGIVYATDARVSDAVTIVATFPPESHPTIRYSAGQITPEAADFMQYLQQPTTLDVFADVGFLPPVARP